MTRMNSFSEMLGGFQTTASIWLMMLFLILMHFPALPVSSIPLVLFVVVCIADWPKVVEMLKEYKLLVALVFLALFVGILFSYKPGKSIKGVYDFLRGAVIFFPALYLVRKYPEKIQSSLMWVSFLCSLMYLSYVSFAVFFVSGGNGWFTIH